ncbi:MAG: PDZ domain-containing protein [Gemmatimonadota bacterium]
MKRVQGARHRLGAWLGLGALLGLSVGHAVAQEKQEEEEAERTLRREIVVTSGVGSGGYLGVRIGDVNEEVVGRLGLPEERGALILEVVDDSPAQEAGLRADDVVQSWNGARVESAAQLGRLARETPPGRSVRLGVFRDGREQVLSVELGDRSGPRVFRVGPDRKLRLERLRERGEEGPGLRFSYAFSFRGRLGVRVEGLSDQLAEYFGVEGGALITEVVEDSPAEKAGLKAGDVILSVAGEEVEDRSDLVRALRDQEAGPVEVRVMRDRRELTVTVELEEETGDGAFLLPGGGVRFAPVGPREFRFRMPRLPVIDLDLLGLPRREWRFRMPELQWWMRAPGDGRIVTTGGAPSAG